jgi:hypothetical protein
MEPTVIAAIDNSLAAQPVLAAAKLIAPLLDAVPLAVHVSEGPAETAEAVAGAEGVALTTIAHRAPVEAVCEALDEPQVVMGVLGSRSARGGQTPAGHTALAVLQRVAKPVLIVSPTARVDRTGTTLRVGVALENGEDYVPGPMLQILLDHDVEVVVVHVFDTAHAPAFWEQSQHAYEAWAHELSLRHFPNGRAAVLLRGGRPGEEILKFVRAEGIHLLILHWARCLAGGHARTVQEILSSAEVPVLLLPIPAATRPGVLPAAASR